jgi:hypothetical protein
MTATGADAKKRKTREMAKYPKRGTRQILIAICVTLSAIAAAGTSAQTMQQPSLHQKDKVSNEPTLSHKPAIFSYLA